MRIEGQNITFDENLIDFLGEYPVKVRLYDEIEEYTEYDWTIILTEKIIVETFVFEFDWDARDKKSIEETQKESKG